MVIHFLSPRVTHAPAPNPITSGYFRSRTNSCWTQWTFEWKTYGKSFQLFWRAGAGSETPELEVCLQSCTHNHIPWSAQLAETNKIHPGSHFAHTHTHTRTLELHFETVEVSHWEQEDAFFFCSSGCCSAFIWQMFAQRYGAHTHTHTYGNTHTLTLQRLTNILQIITRWNYPFGNPVCADKSCPVVMRLQNDQKRDFIRESFMFFFWKLKFSLWRDVVWGGYINMVGCKTITSMVV